MLMENGWKTLCLQKDVKKWMLETTLPKYEDFDKDSNPFRAFDFFLTKRTSFFPLGFA